MRGVFYDNSNATLMSAVSVLRQAANQLYEHAFPIYRPLYAAYKAYADRAERELLRQVLFPGSIVVDAGANIGIYSEFLSRCVEPNGIVHSFEPSPENFKRLRSATRKLANVRLSQAAVGERSRRSELYLSDKLNVDHRAYAAEGDSRRTVPIEMVALEDYFKPSERVDLIKMDVQGFELHALRGAKRVIQENPGIKLLLEFWPYGLKQAGARWEEVVEMLRDFGMDLMLVNKKTLTPFDAADVHVDISWYVNVFACRNLEAQRLVLAGR
jgi:FkbM family methyltransferase